jgi:hypothetical protein
MSARDPDAGVAPASGRYSVDVRRGKDGWSVAIAGASGAIASVRACADEQEARTFASTVRQHAEWLSEAKFREYYRLTEDV